MRRSLPAAGVLSLFVISFGCSAEDSPASTDETGGGGPGGSVGAVGGGSTTSSAAGDVGAGGSGTSGGSAGSSSGGSNGSAGASAAGAGGKGASAAEGGVVNMGFDAALVDAGHRVAGSSATGCGSTPRSNMYEGRPRSCVSAGVCEALSPRGIFAPAGTPPNLKMGAVTELGPPFPIADGGNALSMTLDPNNTAILYVGVEAKNGPSPDSGVWRSKDAGSSWTILGGPDNNIYDCLTTSIEVPVNVRVDPLDSDHLYVTSGVRGAHTGFWVSWDGGQSWTRARDGDLTAMSVDPCDFCHVIVGSHDGTPVGVLETTDGGYSWVQHAPPAGADWSGGSYGVSFLYDPASGQGNAKTWLVHNGQMWRTQDAGTSWTKVADIGGIHGFTTIYYAKNGALYSGSGTYPVRSTDNGATWKLSQQGLTGAFYYGLTGDGTNIYAMPDGYPPALPLMSTPESNGTSWTVFGDGNKIQRGMQHPRFDPKSGIVYFVNNLKLNAVRVADPR